jgi:hypothetical protein
MKEDSIETTGPLADKLRIYCASTSVEHERAPVTAAFNRMELSVSGFLIEEEGEGSRIVQITDLSGLGCEFLAFPSQFYPESIIGH